VAQTLAVGALALGRGQLGVLGHALDELRHARAELLADLGQRHGGVLDDVVQQRGGHHLLVVAASGQQTRDVDGMGDEGAVVLAALTPVRGLGEGVGAAHQGVLRSGLGSGVAHTSVFGSRTPSPARNQRVYEPRGALRPPFEAARAPLGDVLHAGFSLRIAKTGDPDGPSVQIRLRSGPALPIRWLFNERANPSQGGGAKPRNPPGQPSCRKEREQSP
jgi:hypothetical protein